MMRVRPVLLMLVLLGSAVVIGHRALRPTTGLAQDIVAAERLVEDVARRVVADPFQLVMPADLAPAHRDVPELADCQTCHELTSNVPDAKCLACHEDIAEGLETRSGHHGVNLRGSCARCHADHQQRLISFEPDGFRHDQARFPLSGAHITVDCAKCHRASEAAGLSEAAADARMNYIGLTYQSCTGCHEDPHADGVSLPDCSDCHTTDGWAGPDLIFDHNTQADFQLDATHRSVACDACHQPRVFRPLASDCVSCHADVDGFLRGEVLIAGELETWKASPHADLVSCRDCHDTSVLSQNSTDYAEACARCHTPLHAQLFLERDAHLRGLLIEARRLATTDAQHERLDAAERVGSHAFAAAEQHAAGFEEPIR